MTTVQATNASSTLTATSASTATTATTSASDAQNQFLSLLVAQMQNQDPTQPLSNAEVTTQMAQLSTVQGIDNMNSSIQSLVASLGSSQMGQATSLIGHNVLAPGNSVSPSQPGDVLGFNLSQAADTVTVNIKDATGAAVRTINLGAQPAGVNMQIWDGLDDKGNAVSPTGAYQFTVTATQAGAAVTSTALNVGTVNSVSQNAQQGVQLNLSNNGQASYADIQQVF
jgi:flagellar basal-body rod modification protein FlgD